MTIDEYRDKIKKQAEAIISGKAVFTAASTTVSHMSTRIFVEGKNSNGTQIGNYNTTDPLYVNPLVTKKKFPLKGKNGNEKFKSGKSHKTGYFDSYADFRKEVGRPVAFVNLVLTSDLKKNFDAGVVRINDFEYDLILTRESNVNKADGAEDRFGVIFKTTKEEKELYYRTLAFEQLQPFRQ